jgi:hypothetical protein
MTIHSDKVYFLNSDKNLFFQLKMNRITDPFLSTLLEEFTVFLKKTTGTFVYLTGFFVLTRMIKKYFNQTEEQKVVLNQRQMILLLHYGLNQAVVNNDKKYFSTFIFFLFLKGTNLKTLTNHTLNQYYCFIILQSILTKNTKQELLDLLLENVNINPYFNIQNSFNEKELPATLLTDYYFQKYNYPYFNNNIDNVAIVDFCKEKYNLTNLPEYFEQLPFKNNSEEELKYFFVLFIKSFNIKRKNKIQFLNYHKEIIFNYFCSEFKNKSFMKQNIKPFYKKVSSFVLTKQNFSPYLQKNTSQTFFYKEPPILFYLLKKELTNFVQQSAFKIERTCLVSNIRERIFWFNQSNIIFSFSELLYLACFINEAISELPGITEFLPQLCQKYFKTSLTEFYAKEEYFKRAVLPTEEHSLPTKDAYLLLKQLKPVYLENIQNYELTCI